MPRQDRSHDPDPPVCVATTRAEWPVEPELPGWVVRSPAIRHFLAQLDEAAGRHGPVYLYGEPGAGRTCATSLLRRWRAERRRAEVATVAHATLRTVCASDAALAQVTILRVPSLRERGEDLPGLAEGCLATLAHRDGTPRRFLTAAALEDLAGREWRGNLRELEEVLTGAVRRAGARVLIEPHDLPRAVVPPVRPSQRAKDEAQRDCLLGQLRVAGTVSGAARIEGVSRSNYIRLMHRLGIVRADGVGAERLE
jgi:DNA-binding NtrC family response regulator